MDTTRYHNRSENAFSRWWWWCGMDMGGGGGAGGFLAFASKDIPASEQTVVVGRGGIGAPGASQANILGQSQGGHTYTYPLITVGIRVYLVKLHTVVVVVDIHIMTRSSTRW